MGGRPTPTVRVLRRPEEFRFVLEAPTLVRSPHFSVHHRPEALEAAVTGSADHRLSAAETQLPGMPVDNPLEKPVDNAVVSGRDAPPGHIRPLIHFGLVVPKRHARRAVTRSLVKRQLRRVFLAHAPCLPPGCWVLRLRAPVDRQRFPSAASDALRRTLREELDGLFRRLLTRTPAVSGVALPAPRA